MHDDLRGPEEYNGDLDRWTGGVIYTASFGVPFPQLEPIDRNLTAKGVLAVAYTDSPVPASGWRVVAQKGKFATGRLSAKWHKTQADYLFPLARWTLWVDSSISFCDLSAVLGVVNELVGEGPSAGRRWIGLLRHPDRNNIYGEVIHSVEKAKYAGEPCLDQVAHYLAHGFAGQDLYCGGFILRPGACPGVAAFNRRWLNEIIRWSCQDQLSLPFALSESNIDVSVLPWHLFRNEAFKWKGAGT